MTLPIRVDFETVQLVFAVRLIREFYNSIYVWQQTKVQRTPGTRIVVRCVPYEMELFAHDAMESSEYQDMIEKCIRLPDYMHLTSNSEWKAIDNLVHCLKVFQSAVASTPKQPSSIPLLPPPEPSDVSFPSPQGFPRLFPSLPDPSQVAPDLNTDRIPCQSATEVLSGAKY